jgi:hypothetical protein
MRSEKSEHLFRDTLVLLSALSRLEHLAIARSQESHTGNNKRCIRLAFFTSAHLGQTKATGGCLILALQRIAFAFCIFESYNKRWRSGVSADSQESDHILDEKRVTCKLERRKALLRHA